MDWGNGEFVFVDGSDWEFVFMDWGNWKLVFVDGSDGQVVTLGLESSIIGGPGQSESLAFGRNPVRFSLVSVAEHFLFGFFAVVIDFGDDEFLLLLILFASGSIRSSVANNRDQMNNELLIHFTTSHDLNSLE